MLPGRGASSGLIAGHAALGQTIAFDQRHADRLVKFRQIRAQRRRARYRQMHPSAQSLANFPEHHPVRQR